MKKRKKKNPCAANNFKNVKKVCFINITFACGPHFSVFRVDFLSLDIEGAELDVLKTIIWDKIDIR